MPQTLQLILVLLGCAVVVVAACRLFRLPPILGYLIVGIAVGPHALAGCRRVSNEAASPNSASSS